MRLISAPQPTPCAPPIAGLEQASSVALPVAVVLGILGIASLIVMARLRRTRDVPPAAAAAGWVLLGLAFLAGVVAVFTSARC